MELVIGGAYQGKTDWAKAQYGLSEADISICENGAEADLRAPCVTHLERFALTCLRAGIEPAEALLECKAQWQHHVLICDDINCGVVPMDAETRAWREACGRMLNRLAKEADSVYRIFCGLPLQLK